MGSKILVGFIEDGRHSGIDRYLLNFLKTANSKGVKIDFLTSVYDSSLAKILNQSGSRLFSVPSLKSPLAQYKAIKKIISEGDYYEAYFNISEPLNCIGPICAKKQGLPVLVHSHNSGIDSGSAAKRSFRKIINAVCRPFLNKCCDKRLTCSKKAAKWLFGGKSESAVTIFNAADTEKFKFDPDIRSQVREDLGLGESDKAVGFVGHLCYQKNPEFMISVFDQIHKKDSSARLFICGCGVMQKETERLVSELEISDSVCFLGVRSDVERLMQAFDILLLPSRFEGLPMVAVEAQMCGLPVLMSDSVTEECIIGRTAEQLPLSFSAKLWAEKAISLSGAGHTPHIDENSIKKFSLEFQREQAFNDIISFGGRY